MSSQFSTEVSSDLFLDASIDHKQAYKSTLLTYHGLLQIPQKSLAAQYVQIQKH